MKNVPNLKTEECSISMMYNTQVLSGHTLVFSKGSTRSTAVGELDVDGDALAVDAPEVAKAATSLSANVDISGSTLRFMSFIR